MPCSRLCTCPPHARCTIRDEDLPEIIELSEEETLALFDKEARELLGMSGDEFRRRWLAGEVAGRRRSAALILPRPSLRPVTNRAARAETEAQIHRMRQLAAILTSRHFVRGQVGDHLSFG